MDRDTIAGKAGLAPFIVKRLLGQISRFSLNDLRQAVEDCVDAEEAIKTGKLGDRLAVEMLIVKYSSQE